MQLVQNENDLHLTKLEKTRMGRRLRDIRQQRQLTIRELADRAGISDKHLGNIEHNGKSVSLDTLVVLVRMLDVSLDYIVLGVRPQMGGWGLIFRSDDELDALVLLD